jgi:hypothetical protein
MLSRSVIFRSVILSASAALFAACGPSLLSEKPKAPIHVDLEASSSELQAMTMELPKTDMDFSSPEDKRLTEIIETGKRNLQWFVLIAKNQPAGSEPLSLSQKDTKGIPIEKASKYNGQTIITEFDATVPATPEAMKRVLIDKTPLTNKEPVELKQYLEIAGKYDRLYQLALRWRMYQPYLQDMAALKRYDVRGYYFLNKRANLQHDLENWDTLTAEDQKNLREWLINECFNTLGDDFACSQALDQAIANKTLWTFHTEKSANSSAVYGQFFDIWDIRQEGVWNDSNPNKMIMPFRTPANPKIKEALRVNIQDEWKWNGWQLELSFHPKAAVHINFEDGAVPNVNGVAGDTITMDANTPLEDETTKFALRHEFGHVLGFPDCYLEFYDETEKIMISYQIDVTDIMCSRAGKFKQRHLDELKEAYFHGKSL